MSTLGIFAVSLGYLALLFGIAYLFESRKRATDKWINNSWGYALSLAVYCTGWTYYGSVGRAATGGMEFITIFIGPSIMCALFYPVLQKILRISKSERISSIADFIATRYGKSFYLGFLVTICCIFGVIPYVALQLKAVSTSFHILNGTSKHYTLNFFDSDTFFLTFFIMLFIMLFGVRSIEASERHPGLVSAIAFESLIKLIAFVSVGIFVTYSVFHGFGDSFAAAKRLDLKQFFSLPHGYSSWFTMIILSMASMILLPRQFQVTVGENVHENHLKKASWMFPLYLFLINIFVIPIAIAGVMYLNDDIGADSYVLALPLKFGHNLLSLLVYIGGFAASSSMVAFETIALSNMVSNHLVLPIIFSWKRFAGISEKNVSRIIMLSRRASIFVILVLAYIYNVLVSPHFSLIFIGLMSMAAVVQFAPTVIGALYWKGATRQGALCSIIVGFAVWLYTLILPSVADAGYFSQDIVNNGPWGIWWLRPHTLFGLTNLDVLPHSFLWSMFFNAGTFLIVSIFTKQNAQEVYEARIFVDIFKNSKYEEEYSVWRGTALTADVVNLLSRFIGKARTIHLLEGYTHRNELTFELDQPANPLIVSFAEKILSGVIGSASASFMVRTITKEEEVSLQEVFNIVKESQQVLELNKELRKKSTELMRATNQLRQTNERLKEIDELKNEFLYTVTHELRTPLTSVRAMSEIIADNPDMDEEMRQTYLEGIVKEIERLSIMINQVLDLEKFESGRQELSFQKVDLHIIISEIIISLEGLRIQNNVNISNHINRPLFVECDKEWIRQVIYNLISNALKFVPKKNGLIDIDYKVEKQYIVINVNDNGKGVPVQERGLIFDKFFQARNQTIKKPVGSGLGLAICKKIIEMHKGKIWVESGYNNLGANFVFTLPLVQEDESENLPNE